MKNTKQDEFTSLMLTGKYTQKELAARLEVSEVTASRWAKSMQPLKYFSVRKALANDLERLSKKGYENNHALISQLISDIERVDTLIRKAKYIPHLTRKKF